MFEFRMTDRNPKDAGARRRADESAGGTVTRRFRRLLSDEKGGWEITFCGFVLILLAFFIMLSSFATMEQSKVTAFVRSFSDAVSILNGGLKFTPRKDILVDSPDITDSRDILPALEKIVQGLKLNNEVQFSAQKSDLVMTLPDTVIFNLGRAEVTPEAFPLLKDIGLIISKTHFPVRIEGHTDNLPIRTEQFPSNWELSAARAVNVLRYFVEGEGVRYDRVSAVGYGEFHPLFPNDSPEHRAKNRRVEIVFVGAGKDFRLDGANE